MAKESQLRKLEHGIPAVLVGSGAASHWWGGWRRPVDYDVYCNDHAMSRSLRDAGFDVQFASERNGILDFITDSRYNITIEVNGIVLPVATPLQLLTIKCVHINYPHKWHKNISDYITLTRLVNESPVQSLIDGRTSYLDRITKIRRYLPTPPNFWGSCSASMLDGAPLRSWCIYAIDYELRRFVQDHYGVLNAEINRRPAGQAT